MKNYRLYLLIICLAIGFLSHIKVLADNNIFDLRGSTIEDESNILYDVTYTAIAGTQGFNSSEGYSSLVDGNDNSKWCTSTRHVSSHGGLPYYIIFRASEKISPTWYRLFTGNDTGTYSGRNWKSWKIYGANFFDDNAAVTSYNITSPVNNNSRRSSDWILIDDKNGYSLPALSKTEVNVSISNPSTEKYQYFLVEIYESTGDLTVQMSELSFGSQANDTPDNPIHDKNFLSIPSCIDIRNGERFDLPISMTNEDDICSLQFDLILPNGFVIATDANGKAITELSERTTDKRHSVSFRKLNSGAYRFIIVSATNATFVNNCGEILTIGVFSSDGLSVGDFTMNIQNIILTNPNAMRFVAENVSGILKVVEPVTITAKSYTREYGEPNPTFEYSVEGAALDGQPEIICEATATSPVGEYPIIIKKGSVKNYNDTYVNGVLTITKAPLSIKAKSYSIKQGQVMPTFEAEYTGFKNNETNNIFSKQPSFTCSATSGSALGKYDIVVSGAEAKNYTISYTKGTLTITEADPVKVTAKSYTREYGEANPTFEFTSEGATLEGTPEIICEATPTSPVGEYPIIIRKGSVKNYNDTYVNGVLTITKAPLTVSVGNYTKKQGEANPEFSLSYSGFKNNETEAVLTKQPNVNCGATTSSAPGEYPITVSGAEAKNYNISYTNGKLVVTAADPVKVIAKSYTREYGEANPTFEYSVEGATLEGTPEIICEVTATSPVGEYPIIIRKGSVKNYNDTYINGVLTITKAPLTVSVGNYTKKQGEANPEFTLSYSGFKNNETEAVLKKKPTATTTATESSAPGEYNIVVSGGETENYTLSYKNGILTVVKADAIVITAKSYTREYGEANPTFEYSVEGATLDGTPEIICEATATSPVGEYPIIIRKGSIKNYNDTYVNGVLTITKAPLTISVGNYEKKQYDPMPEFVLSYDGFKNDETEDVLIKQPTISCEANEDSAPGEYAIIVKGAEAENYLIKNVSGKLTVTEPDSYTLTYMVDGEVYQSFTIKYRDAITPLEVPSKEGYTFSGWSEIPATMPAKDVTVTGSFTINSYTLTYMVDGEVYKASTVAYGTILTPEVVPTKEGYTFSGWSEIPATMPAKDVTVTGTFTINSYTLTYMVDGEEYKSFTVKFREAITPLEAPTKEGYTFSGWDGLPRSMPAHDVVVKGSFTINKYKLTYMVDGEEYKSYEINYAATITPEAEPSKEGHTFSGWSEIPETMPANDVIVTGTFTVNSYIVRFMYRDEVLYTEEVNYGEPIPLPELYDDYGLLIKWLDVPETMPAHDIVILVDETDAVLNIQGVNKEDIKIYDLNGHRLASPQKGINIIRYSDGTSRKVLIK